MTLCSPAEHLMRRFSALGPAAIEILRSTQIDPLAGAALAHEWEDFWARPDQLPPDTPWRSWGTFGGRGSGKTRACAEHVTAEVQAGRARQVGLIAQNEDRVWEVMIEGKSGLVSVSPPWFRARPHNNQVYWPNGAFAYVLTPERPDDIFGPEYHLAWASEIHAWPRQQMLKAWSNLKYGNRLGYSRMIWDSNPRKRHALLRMLIERSMRNPARHIIARYTTFDNAANLSHDAMEEWVAESGGTRQFEEMILGRQFDDDEEALFRQEWIDKARRTMPAKLKRRILSVDPAVSMREGTDATGIADLGLGLDDQIYTIDDLSARISVEQWSRLIVRAYFASGCDCVIVERNRGGDMPVAMLKVACEERGATLIQLPLEARCPGHCPGVMHTKEVVSRQSKEVRAEGAAPLVERGRVSFVEGAALNDLEDEMTTWVPGPKVESPNRLDAFVHGVWELAGLWSGESKRSGGIEAAAKANAELVRIMKPREKLGAVGRGILEAMGAGRGRAGL